MTKRRKNWEPEYRFGGNPADTYRPNRLGENQYRAAIKKPKRKR